MSRALAFAAALGASLFLVLVPFLVVPTVTPRVHAIMPVILLGLAGLFVHGVGFTPRHPVWRWLFSPWLAWPIVIGGFAVLLD